MVQLVLLVLLIARRGDYIIIARGPPLADADAPGERVRRRHEPPEEKLLPPPFFSKSTCYDFFSLVFV